MKLLKRLVFVGLIVSLMSTGFAQSNDVKIQEKNEKNIEVKDNEDNLVDNKVEKKEEVISFKGLSRYDIRHDNRPGKKGETRKSLWRNRWTPWAPTSSTASRCCTTACTPTAWPSSCPSAVRTPSRASSTWST